MNYENEEKIEEEIEVLTSGERLLNIFYAPGKVFKSINNKPNFWLPMIITIVVNLLLYLVFFGPFRDAMLEGMIAQSVNNPAMPAEAIEKMSTIIAGVMVGAIPITVAIGIFLLAVFYWLGSMIFKGKGTYMKFVSLMAHVGLISVLSLVVTGIMAIFTGEFLINQPVTSLSSLLPDSMQMSPISVILSSFEVFNIWRLLLVALGIQEISGISRSKAFLIVGIIFLIGILISGGSMLFNARSMYS